jgi:hypothetical protein
MGKKSSTDGHAQQKPPLFFVAPPKKTGRICRYDPEYVKLKSDER